MEEFERQLKDLSVERPPEALRERIFDGEPAQRSRRPVWQGRIPIGWAAILCIVAGAAGFLLAGLQEESAPSAETVGPAVQVWITGGPSAPHPFDFSQTQAGPFDGELEARVETNRGV